MVPLTSTRYVYCISVISTNVGGDEGKSDGTRVGTNDGDPVGIAEGVALGRIDGKLLGILVGSSDG